MSLTDLTPLALDLALAAGAVLVFTVDLLLPLELRRRVGLLAALVLGGVLAASFMVDTSGSVGTVYAGGPWVLLFKQLFLSAGLLAVLGGEAHVAEKTRLRQGEYYLLVIMSLQGMLLLPGARDLLLLVVCFELMSIPLYVLAAYTKTDVPPPELSRGAVAEGALKLYLVGVTSTAVTLFGLSLVVGAAGSTSLAAVAQLEATPLLGLGLMLMLGGLGYKLGVAPFHMWVPDAYQASATPFVAFLSVAPKLAALSALAVIVWLGFASQAHAFVPALAALCAVTLILGNLLAAPQSNVKRLLAYSGVAQMGYLVMGIAAGADGTAMALFYGASYVASNTGVFLVVHAVHEAGGNDSVASFAGLSRRSPYLGLALLVFLLSLAGIPFVSGFWAKLYVFIAAFAAGLEWLVVLGAVLAIVSLFYYLRVAKAAYLSAPEPAAAHLRPGLGLHLAIAACLAAVIGLGLWPEPMVRAAQKAAQILAEKGDAS